MKTFEDFVRHWEMAWAKRETIYDRSGRMRPARLALYGGVYTWWSDSNYIASHEKPFDSVLLSPISPAMGAFLKLVKWKRSSML